MLTKVVFPNPFGFPKPEQTEVLILQETYHFSNEYAKFLYEQNGFNDLVFFESNYNDFTTMFLGEEPWQLFGCLYGLNSTSDYYDLLEAQTYNIFEHIFFHIGTDPAGNSFVEILQGSKKGWIGCIDHDLYITHETLDSFLTELEDETDFEALNKFSKAELADILVSEDLGFINFHAKSMNEFLANCFIIQDETILIKDI